MGRAIQSAVDFLRLPGDTDVVDKNKAALRIAHLVEAYESLPSSPGKRRQDLAIYALAILYVDVTGMLPGYSNSDNATHFERFVEAALGQSVLRATTSSIKASLRRLKLKKDVAFALDVKRVTGIEMIKIAAE